MRDAGEENIVSDLKELPPDFVCPGCDTVLEYRSLILGHHDQPITKGQMIICSTCARTLKVGDSALVIMDRKELENLPPELKEVLKMTLVSVISNMRANKG